MRIYQLLLIILLGISGCSTHTNELNKTSYESSNTRKIYQFQHKVLPSLTFGSGSQFYENLAKGNMSQIRKSATTFVSAGYANGITTKVISGKNAVLIIFPKPKSVPNCYFALIIKRTSGYAFYTYEKTMKFGSNDNVVGMVGGWLESGTHINMGPRTYMDSTSFVRDVLGNKKK